MKQNIKLSIALVAIALGTCSVALAQEKKLKREQLPPAVEKTVARESQGATINGFATEIENGLRRTSIQQKDDTQGRQNQCQEWDQAVKARHHTGGSSDKRASRSAAVCRSVRSSRMSSGPSCWKLKPRSGAPI